MAFLRPASRTTDMSRPLVAERKVQRPMGRQEEGRLVYGKRACEQLSVNSCGLHTNHGHKLSLLLLSEDGDVSRVVAAVGVVGGRDNTCLLQTDR